MGSKMVWLNQVCRERGTQNEKHKLGTSVLSTADIETDNFLFKYEKSNRVVSKKRKKKKRQHGAVDQTNPLLKPFRRENNFPQAVPSVLVTVRIEN